MASLYKKVIHGRPYWYLREMGWVDGKPKMVSERYLGTAAEVEALLAGIEQRLNLARGAQIPLGDHLGFAVHPAHLAQVPVRPAMDHLLVQTRHTLGHRPFRHHDQAPEPVCHKEKRVHPPRGQKPETHYPRKLGLARRW